jgi:hypothetical protein
MPTDGSDPLQTYPYFRDLSVDLHLVLKGEDQESQQTDPDNCAIHWGRLN